MEGEALLLGIWRNVEDLEESLSLPELETILTAARDKEKRHQTFMAAIQGIDLDKGGEDAKERFDSVKRRVEAKRKGKSEEQLAFESMGIDFA